VARVRAILRRVNGITPEHQALTYGTMRLDSDQHIVTLDGQPVELTPTEFDLLRLFLSQPSHAFTRQELIEQGLGYRYEGLERTVDSHIKKLRSGHK
jgi:DNA-binding response OmpR family regulator